MDKVNEEKIQALLNNEKFRYLRDIQENFDPEDDDDEEFIEAINWAVQEIQNQFALICAVRESIPETQECIDHLESVQAGGNGHLSPVERARLKFTLIRGGKQNGVES